MNFTLPTYRLAIFDGEENQNDSGANAGGQNSGTQNDGQAGAQNGAQNGGSQNDGQRGSQSNAQGGNRNDDASSRQSTNDGGRENGQGDYERNRMRGNDGRYESRDEYEQRIRTLNQENADRRRENRELKTTLDVVQRRAIRADVLEAVRAAKPFSDNAATRIADMFMADMGDAVKLDGKTGQTVGLDKLAEWKKANPDFFKADDAQNDGSQNGGSQADGKTANGATDGKDGKRGNATSAGTSQGANSGAGENTEGLPDLSKLKTPAERKAAIDAWKRGLNGSGASGGYGRASSKR